MISLISKFLSLVSFAASLNLYNFNEIASSRPFSNAENSFVEEEKTNEIYHKQNLVTAFYIKEQLILQNSYYDSLLNNTDDEETKIKISNLKNVTEYYASKWEDDCYVSLTEFDRTVMTRGEDFATTAILSFFSVNQYQLSYELLAHSLDVNTVFGETYLPVHWYRVFQSNLSYDLANGTSISGNGIFTNQGNNYERDLRFAIQRFDYEKPTSTGKEVIIHDTYDYDDSDDYDWPESAAVDYLYNLQENGTLVNYEIYIVYDTSYVLRLETVSHEDNIWSIRVRNPNSNTIEFSYNQKTCYGNDAKNWTNLYDLSYSTLIGFSSMIINIEENGIAADTIAFSVFSENSVRHVLYGRGMNENGAVDFSTREISKAYDGQITLIGKEQNRWIFRAHNPYSHKALVEYNRYLCTYDDARNWTGLTDIIDFYLNGYSHKYFYVYENGFSTSVAITFSNSLGQTSFYADGLSLNGNINLNVNTRSKNIRIENLGKTGSQWKIRIKNPSSTNLAVQYCPRMCFENDAKNWTNLGSVNTTTIQAYGCVDVNISENWFATHIALSIIESSLRKITYADGLNSNKSIRMQWRDIAV